MKIKKVTLQLETLTCPSCVKKLETALTGVKGVETAAVMFVLSKVKVSYDEALVDVESLVKRINQTGFRVMGQ